MLEFTSAVLTSEEEAERETKIKALVAGRRRPEDEAKIKALMTGEPDPEREGHWLKEPMTRREAESETGVTEWDLEPMSREDAESEVDEDPYTDFMLDGRKMRAYQPTSGQLAFMLASLGRGQTSDQRFAAILNIMFECLRDEDKDHLESRMLTRDKKKRLDLPVLERIFEGLTKEWFARPTK